MTSFRKFLLVSSVLTLAACGGNGDSSDPAPAPPPPASVGPTAAFTVATESGQVPLNVGFTSTSTAGSEAITEYFWDFGDGTTSTAASPTHTYTVAGDYDVQLTVTTSVGSDVEAKADFIDVDPAESSLPPSEIVMFNIDGRMVEAAKNQVIIFFEEDVTEDQRDTAYLTAENLGAGVQSFNTELRTAQLRVDDDMEVSTIEALEGLDGISLPSLNFIVTETSIERSDNQSGYEKWEKTEGKKPIRSYFPRSEKVEIAPFIGDYWVDQINLEAALTELEDVTLDPNTIAIVDTGLPASQSIIAESRVTRIDENGNALTDDATFGVFDRTVEKPDQMHGRDVIGFAAGSASMITGVNATSDVISVDVYRDRTDFLFFERDTRYPTITEIGEGVESAIDAGASVVNVSWGPGGLSCSSDKAIRTSANEAFRTSISGAVNYARRRNANVVFSSGNHCEKEDNQRLSDPTDNDNDSWTSNALVVGASNEERNDACFSVMGSVVDLSAPGDQVSFGNNQEINGTSFAAPIVAGALGIVRSVNDSLGAPEARAIIMNTVDRNLQERTVAQNQLDGECFNVDGTSSFPDDAGVATLPQGLLNLGSAVNTALLAKDIDLTTLDGISLDLGETQTVAVDVTLPEEGVVALDLIFVIDRSGSYSDDINTLQTQASNIISNLSESGIDIQYGVTSFSDFPVSPYGVSSDEPFTLLQSLTSDTDATIDAINRLDRPLQNGNDFPESQYEALFQVANGAAGFREGALPIILFATDADFHDSDVDTAYPGAGRTETLAALVENNITVFGLQSGSSSAATSRMNELAEQTDGAVFNLDRSSSEIATAISDAVNSALADADITLETLAGLDWVKSITPEKFEDVQAGETVTFEVEFEGIRNGSFFGDLDYEVYLWARADEEALISRYFQSIDPD